MMFLHIFLLCKNVYYRYFLTEQSFRATLFHIQRYCFQNLENILNTNFQKSYSINHILMIFGSNMLSVHEVHDIKYDLESIKSGLQEKF